MTYTVEPIGFINTCFPEKFGIPRQPLLAPNATARLVLQPPYNDPASISGLENVSHVWLSFIFHQHLEKSWKPKVRPPRLGGNKTMGVFATRSSFRPNGLGLSVVKLDSIDISHQQVCLYFSGVDLLDGTPIVDIKPYVPYVDCVPHATNGIAEQSPHILPVVFLGEAASFCEKYQQQNSVDITSLIQECLQQDPRPAYQKKDHGREYGVSLLDCNVRWRVVVAADSEIVEVVNIISSKKVLD